jgi:outer membrane biosynthesis protein TonB
MRGQSFEDEFNENAKIAVNVTVDAGGRVTSASYSPVGSTSTNAAMKSIALRRARELKFNAGGDGQTGTVIFNFRLRN